MKRALILVVMMMSFVELKAQDCETLLLPFFDGNREAMNAYPAEKQDWRCCFARVAFYEADQVPDGAEVMEITEVVSRENQQALTTDFKVDLEKLSYYAYNFRELQQRFPRGNVVLCFPTPGSEHPYLVLRSLEEMFVMADALHEGNRRK